MLEPPLYLKISSQIHFIYPIILLALFQLIEMLIRVTNLFKSEEQLARKPNRVNWPQGYVNKKCSRKVSTFKLQGRKTY